MANSLLDKMKNRQCSEADLVISKEVLKEDHESRLLNNRRKSMTKYLLEVELKNDKYCYDCPCLETENDNCTALDVELEIEYTDENKNRYSPYSYLRSPKCPLIKVEDKRWCENCEHAIELPMSVQARCIKRDGLIVPYDYSCKLWEARDEDIRNIK